MDITARAQITCNLVKFVHLQVNLYQHVSLQHLPVLMHVFPIPVRTEVHVLYLEITANVKNFSRGMTAVFTLVQVPWKLSWLLLRRISGICWILRLRWQLPVQNSFAKLVNVQACPNLEE
ncbi:uncharacterized protein LOC144632697 [Oculina patagonica]